MDLLAPAAAGFRTIDADPALKDRALPNPVLGLSSKDLAHHAAGVYAANGVHAHTLPPDSPRYMSTPEMSFAVRHLTAHGGLNLTPSHNPPHDNGLKFS